MARRPVLLPRGRLIAHRGGGAHAPENTLQALAGVPMLGTDWAEVDVRLTGCGTPVLLHDPDLDATTSGSGPLAAVAAADLARMDAALWFGAGAVAEPPATLARALALAARIGLGLNLELKPPAEAGEDAALGLVTAVARAIEAAPLPPGRLVVTSTSAVVVSLATRLLPTLPVGPVLRRPADAAAMAGVIATADLVVVNARRFGPRAIRALRSRADPPLVLVYGTDSRRRLRRLIRAGAAAAIVDAPDRILGAPLPTPLLPVWLRRLRNRWMKERR
ncbi:glycerophosphodiester phosphodiesterase family protein [Tistrella mobilis]